MREMKVFYDDGLIKIRSMLQEDAKTIFDTQLSYGWHPSMDTYETYYSEQENQKRLVFIAEYRFAISSSVESSCLLTYLPDAL